MDAAGESGAIGTGALAPPRRRGRLAQKYTLLFIGLVGFALLINSGFDFWFSYQENKDALIRIQQEKADAAAQRIAEFIGEIQRQIGWTTDVQWASEPLDQRRFDYARLLRQVPAITELSQLDPGGKQLLMVSRLAMDLIGSNADFSQSPAFTEAKAHGLWFSPVYFRKESEPYVTLAIKLAGRNAGVTVAEINLKLMWDVVTGLKIGQRGYAYVVDGKGKLIAHPDISLVLRDTDLSKLPQVAGALGPASSGPDAGVAENIAGGSVLTAHAGVTPTGWLVFVEVPLSEAFAPLYGQATRSLALLAAGLAVAALVAIGLARRMTGPIRELQAGAAEIGAGALDRRIEVHTGDELEALAGQFNAMATDLQSSYAELEGRVVARTAELSEALAQQTATAEVLQVINSSPGDLTPVFEAMLEKATRLCDANFGVLLTYDGERFDVAALHNVPPGYAAFMTNDPPQPGSETAMGRILRGERVVLVEDAGNSAAYLAGDARRRAFVDLGGARSYVCVGLFKDDRLLGTLGAYRNDVAPFTDKQIAVLQNFAAQAVIAMENARLMTETREALEYQTATADVLKVISRSTFDLDPVLTSVVTTATQLCRATYAVIYRYRDGAYRYAVSHGLLPEYEKIESETPIYAGRGTVVGRAAQERRVVQIVDALADPEYEAIESAIIGNARTMIGVPLMREGEPIGAIALSRGIVEPFTDKQIELITTFADQAVIAIENARLLSELRESTDELARSVDELTVLNEVSQAVSSTLDLQSVLSTILTRSVDLSGADAGVIFRYNQAARAYSLVEAHGWDAELVERVKALHIDEVETGMGEAAAQRIPVQFADLSARPSYPLRDLTMAAGFRSVMIVPLVGAERTFGAIVLERRTTGEFSPETMRLMQTLAAQSVLAIQNARLFREIADKSEELALASQHKSQFLANMSHELRTPLNAILGYTELMVDGIYGALPDRANGVLERVQNNGRHLLALINDVLDLSKIEAGQLVLTLEEYTLADVVQTVVSATESLANNKGLALSATIEPGLPTGHGDARRLAQVLLNLVGNALKFTDVGEVTIGAKRERSQFVVTVRDTGPGIALGDQDRIFGEFQQVDNSNTRQKGGTGLGLAISKRMVEMQGGKISLESEVGHGSTFRVALPIRVEAVTEELMGAA